MKIRIQAEADGSVYVAAIDEASGAPEHRKSVSLQSSQEIDLDLPDLVSADQIGFGSVIDSESGDVVTPSGDEAKESADTPGGGNEGSSANGEPPVPEAGGEGAGPTSAEGEGGGAPAEGGSAQNGEPATTSAASEKPLYVFDGGAKVPEEFVLSGLETPDGKELYHYAGDTAGQSATGNADGVSVYADADDNEKPVQPAAPSETSGGAATA